MTLSRAGALPHMDTTKTARGDRSQRVVRLLVESEGRPVVYDEDWPFDEVRLLEHQRDGLALRRGQRPLLEHGAAAAHIFEERRVADMLLEKRAGRRRAVDVTLLHVDPALCQMTSGVLAGRSGRLPVEDRLGHGEDPKG